MLDNIGIEYILERLDTKEVLVLEISQNNSVKVIDPAMYAIGVEALWSYELLSIDKEKFFSRVNLIYQNKIGNVLDGYVIEYISLDSLVGYIKYNKTRVVVLIGDISKNELVIKQVFKEATFESMELHKNYINQHCEKARCGKVIIDNKKISFYLVHNPREKDVFLDGDYVIFYFSDLIKNYIFSSISRYDNVDVMDIVDFFKIKKYSDAYKYLKTEKSDFDTKVIEDLEKLSIEEIENKLFEINEYIGSIIVELVRLDEEYNDNIDDTILRGVDYFLLYGKRKPEYEDINNKSWEGYWKNCTGHDFLSFISSLKTEIFENEEVYDNQIISRFFLNRAGYTKITYGVAMANDVYRKLFR